MQITFLHFLSNQTIDCRTNKIRIIIILFDYLCAYISKVVICLLFLFLLLFYGLQKWKISCFRHEDFSPVSPKSDNVEHFLPEEPVKPEFENSTEVKRDWKSTLREVNFTFFIFLMAFFTCCQVNQ